MTDIRTETVKKEVVLFLYERRNLPTSANTPIKHSIGPSSSKRREGVKKNGIADLAVLEGLFTKFKTCLTEKKISTRDKFRQLKDKDDFNLLLDPAWKGPKSVDVRTKFKIQDGSNEFNGTKPSWAEIRQSSSVQELWEKIRGRLKKKEVDASQDKGDKEKMQRECKLSEGVMTSSQGKETDVALLSSSEEDEDEAGERLIDHQ